MAETLEFELKKRRSSKDNAGFEPAIGNRARRGGLHRFTAKQVDLLPEGLHSDGGGLVLQVDGGSRRWRFRYARDGRTYYVSLGSAADRTLAEVRAKAAECRNLLADHIDPRREYERRAEAERDEAARQAAAAASAAATLETVARAYHAAHLHEWTEKHGGEWLRSLENHIFPTLGARPIAEVEPAELLDLLLPLRASNPETGQRLRQRLDAIFADALLRKQCRQNPAAAILKALRLKKRTRRHFAAMDYRALPAFVQTIRTSEKLGTSAALAFEFLILTAARTAEVLGATWAEIDEERRTWTIGAARMKARRPHVVYLAPRALELLRAARPLRAVDPQTGEHKPGDFVFPSPHRPTRALSNMVFLNALGRLGLWGPEAAERVTAHGFRATFSTWANEQHFPPDVIEAALAHGEANAVRAAYNRAEYVEQRKRLAEAWAEFCEGAKPKRLRVVGGAK
jgi:integrase